MPWNESDVDKHKKGLTSKQKGKWVSVANSVRAKCVADGGNEAECDAKAIRVANSQVAVNRSSGATSNFDHVTHIQVNSYTPQVKMHKGEKYIVVPVVMLNEGVHNGSHGPILHTSEEFGRWPASWNGIPITINHPMVGGIGISANDPDIVENDVVGRTYYSECVGQRLKAQAWLSESKLAKRSPEALAYIRQGLPLEVSVGTFTDDEPTSGEWNGESYAAIARNHRPDHLALLPGEKGACSWEDGCGIRVNKNNEEGGGGKNMPGENKKCCPEKVELLIQSEANKFVEGDREFLESQDEQVIDKLLAQDKETQKLVTDLAERDKTIGANQTQIQQLKQENEELKKKDGGQPQINKEDAAKVLKETLNDPEQFASLLPDNLRQQFDFGMKLHQERRDEFISKISKSTKVYTEEDLKGMTTDALQKLSDAVKPPVDYRGRGGPSTHSEEGPGVLLPPGVKAE